MPTRDEFLMLLRIVRVRCETCGCYVNDPEKGVQSQCAPKGKYTMPANVCGYWTPNTGTVVLALPPPPK
jgi:hypothetical protein